MGFKNTLKQQNELSEILSTHEKLASRDVTTFKKIEKLFITNGTNVKTGEVESLYLIKFSDKTYTYAPYSFRKVIELYLKEKSIEEINDELEYEPIKLKFNKIKLKTGTEFIETHFE